jgi:hypothetical protein
MVGFSAGNQFPQQLPARLQTSDNKKITTKGKTLLAGVQKGKSIESK